MIRVSVFDKTESHEWEQETAMVYPDGYIQFDSHDETEFIGNRDKAIAWLNSKGFEWVGEDKV